MPECFRYDVVTTTWTERRSFTLPSEIFVIESTQPDQSAIAHHHRISVKICFLCLLIQRIIAAAAYLHYRKWRSTGVLRSRNRTKKIGTKLFVLAKTAAFSFLRHCGFPAPERTSENGEQNAGCKCVRLRLLIHQNPDNAENLLPGTKWQDTAIFAFESYASLRRHACDPLNTFCFPDPHLRCCMAMPVNRVNNFIQQSTTLRWQIRTSRCMSFCICIAVIR